MNNSITKIEKCSSIARKRCYPKTLCKLLGIVVYGTMLPYVCLGARKTLAQDGYLRNRSLSPQKTFRLYFPHPDDSNETWLVSVKDSKKRTRLPEPPSAVYWQDGNGRGAPIIYVSPDEKYIVWKIDETSEVNDLILYKRDVALHYHLIGSIADLIGKKYYNMKGLAIPDGDEGESGGGYGRTKIVGWQDGSRRLLLTMLIKHLTSFNATYYTESGEVILHIKR